jgi:iron complex transport system permease protein
VAAAFIGPYPFSLAEALRAVWYRLSGMVPETAATLDTVLFFVRPRVAAAILVGGALAAAGAAYQGLFRNPLVSPDILGVSARRARRRAWHLPVAAGGRHPAAGVPVGLGTVGLVLLIAASVRGREPVLVLVLAGVVVGALAGSAISLLKVLADPYDQLPAITFWLLGSLASIKLEDLLATVPVAALGLVPLALLRWRIRRRGRSGSMPRACASW